MTNTLASITTWHQRARPDPTNANFNVQLGCHLEEVAEMLECLTGHDEYADANLGATLAAVESLANKLKAGDLHVGVQNDQRKEFLDSLADQIVTAVGVGHCANMDVASACNAVNVSNWSKYVDGQPQFNANGKIAKGLNYAPPVLDGLY